MFKEKYSGEEKIKNLISTQYLFSVIYFLNLNNLRIFLKFYLKNKDQYCYF
jgi:hypothetical protein